MTKAEFRVQGQIWLAQYISTSSDFIVFFPLCVCKVSPSSSTAFCGKCEGPLTRIKPIIIGVEIESEKSVRMIEDGLEKLGYPNPLSRTVMASDVWAKIKAMVP